MGRPVCKSESHITHPNREERSCRGRWHLRALSRTLIPAQAPRIPAGHRAPRRPSPPSKPGAAVRSAVEPGSCPDTA